MDQCPECGFTYDFGATSGIGPAVREGTAEVAAILRGDADLRTRREPAVWSPLEYACHLRDVLLVQRERALAARRVDRPVCEPIGRDERVEHDGYAEQDPADVARQLDDATQLFVNVINRLGDGDWDRVLVYPWPEPTERTVEWLALHTAHEVRHHLLDIRRQI